MMQPVTKRMKPRQAEKLVRLIRVVLQLSSVVFSDTESVSSMEDLLDFGLIFWPKYWLELLSNSLLLFC